MLPPPPPPQPHPVAILLCKHSAKANDLFNKRLLLYRNVYTRIIIYHSRFAHIIYIPFETNMTASAAEMMSNSSGSAAGDGGAGGGGGGDDGNSGDGGCFACQTNHAMRNTVYNTKTVCVRV